MPICTREKISIAPKSVDTFRDTDEVFFCETTNEIFTDYEEYFKRIMQINATIWKCEITGKDNLTYVEALKSEKRARKISNAFKEYLRAPALIVVEAAQQSYYGTLNQIVYQFLKDRYFLGETLDAAKPKKEPQPSQQPPPQKVYFESKIIEIIPPLNEVSSDGVYDPLKLKYKVKRIKSVNGRDETWICSCLELRRRRTDFQHETLEYFLKENTELKNGVLVPKASPYKTYIIDGKKHIEKLFVGKLPVWKPSKRKPEDKKIDKIKKQESMSKYLIKNNIINDNNNKKDEESVLSNEKKQKASSTSPNSQKSSKAALEKKMSAEKALKERLEEIRKEKERQEKEKQRQIEERNNKINDEYIKIMQKCDDLERVDQKLLPFYRPVKTFVSDKRFGDILHIQEFLQSFVQILPKSSITKCSLTFYDLARAYKFREVAGPLSKLIEILLETIFALQLEEEDECKVNYTQYMGKTKQDLAMSQAVLAHKFAQKHLTRNINELPIEPLYLSEVLRLHLLGSGATVNENADRWRFNYRNGYNSRDDPGLSLRMTNPHILRALKMYTIYQLSFSDISKVINCLIDQILTYNSALNIIEQKRERLKELRLQLRSFVAQETRRNLEVVNKRKQITSDFTAQSIEINEEEGKRNLEDVMNKEISKILAVSERSKRKYYQELLKLQSSFNGLVVHLGSDRAYRNYYVFESMNGLFIEHPVDLNDNSCLDNPPKNDLQLAYCPHLKRDIIHFLQKQYKEKDKNTSSKMKQLMIDETNATIVKNENKNCVKKTNNFNNNVNGKELSYPSVMVNGHKEEENDNDSDVMIIEDDNETKEIKLLSTTIKSNDESDKENQSITRNGDLKVVKTEKNTYMNGDNGSNRSNGLQMQLPTGKNNDLSRDYSPTELFMCTGNLQNCIVHNIKSKIRTRWSYISEENELESLIENLNPLGLRESQLKEQLSRLKDFILDHMKKCPLEILTFSDTPEAAYKILMKESGSNRNRYTNTNMGFRVNSDINEVMYRALVQEILTVEHDITEGYLGQLKVNDIMKWRNNIQDGLCDPQTNSELDNQQMDKKEFKDPGNDLGDTVNIGESEDSSDDEISLHNSPELLMKIKNLALAILQLARSVDKRFLQEPFGVQIGESLSDEEKEAKLAKCNEKLSHWEISLINSTSFSQLFLHMKIFTESVKWNNSVLKSKCIICRKSNDPENMLLCDECNAGTHMYCNEPKLTSVPKGDWYCYKCNQKKERERAKNESMNRNRKRKIFTDEDDSTEEDDEQQDLEEEDNESNGKGSSTSSTVTGKKKKSTSSSKRRQLRNKDILEVLDEDDKSSDISSHGKQLRSRQQKSAKALKENQISEEEEEDEEDNESNNEDEDENEEDSEASSEYDNDEDDNDDDENQIDEDGVNKNCGKCKSIDCDTACKTCNNWYHSECLNLRRTPRYWECDKCKRKEIKRKRDASESSTDNEDEPDMKRVKRSTRSYSKATDTFRSTSKSTRRSGRNNDLPLDTATLYKLLGEIMKHESSWPFLRPVSQHEVPDYYDIIKKPMDFAKIKSKLNMAEYSRNEELMRDIETIFKNCDTYNRKGNVVYNAGVLLEKFTIKRCEELNLPFKPSDMQFDADS